MTYINDMTRVKHFDDATTTRRDVAQRIYETDAKIAPFLWFARQNKEACIAPKFESFSRTSAVRQTLVNGAIADTTTTSVVVDDCTVFRTGDVIVNALTREVMYITDITTGTNTLTVVRGIGSTAANIADNSPCFAAGSAAEEGDTRLDVVSAMPTEDYNYTQIFKTTQQISGSALATSTYGPKELADDRDRKYRQHLMEMEIAFLFGARHKITSGDAETRFTRGFVPSLGSGSNVWNVSGNITKATLDPYLAGIFAYGNENNVKIGLCNMKFLQYLNTLVLSYLNKDLIKGDEFFGINFREYQNFAGTLKCMEHRMLTRMYTTQAVCAIVDPDYIKYRYLQGRDTTFQEANRDTDLLDGYVGQWLTEAGPEITGVECHGWVYGATGTA